MLALDYFSHSAIYTNVAYQHVSSLHFHLLDSNEGLLTMPQKGLQSRASSIVRTLIVLLSYISTSNAGPGLWPQPTSVISGNSTVWIDNAVRIYIRTNDDIVKEVDYYPFRGTEQAAQDPLVWDLHDARLPSHDDAFVHRLDHPFMKSNVSSMYEIDIVEYAALRSVRQVLSTMFVPWKFYPRRTKFTPVQAKDYTRLESIVIVQDDLEIGKKFDPQGFSRADESYTIVLDVETRITSKSTAGTIQALKTLEQLFYVTPESSKVYAPNTPVHIEDHPKWKHRGLSLDIARNPIFPEDVLKTITVMASCKMNRLHIHATDSQSWPLEIPSMPSLAEEGAYSPEHVWSADWLQEIQNHGVLNGVSVFIEIDMPGHTASVAYAFEELVAGFNMLDWNSFALEPNSGQLKLNAPGVAEFLDRLLQDLLPRTAKYSPFFHLGGDELNEKIYLLDDTVQSEDKAVLQPLVQKFMQQAFDHVKAAGLQPIIWEEMILDWNLTLPSTTTAEADQDVLVQVWRDGARIQEVLEKGYRVLFGEYNDWYLDCGFGGFLDPYSGGKSPAGVPYNTSGGEPSQVKRPYLDYCQPYHNWRHIWTYNPLKDVREDLHHLVHGGEVLMWSEQTDSVDLDFKLWPRAAAAAEVLWSGVRNETQMEDAGRRLAQWRERAVVDLHVAMSPVIMTHCAMYQGCNL